MIKKGGEKSRKKAFAASKCIADSVEQQTVLEKACEAIESDTDRMLESRQAKKGVKAAAAAKKEEVDKALQKAQNETKEAKADESEAIEDGDITRALEDRKKVKESEEMEAKRVEDASELTKLQESVEDDADAEDISKQSV